METFSESTNYIFLQSKLGGINKIVKVDEIDISHGRLETCPSYTSDDFPDITCLVGIIDPQSADIHLEIVSNFNNNG
ncbi:hypothetical protein H312_02599 [Anncaliia algerae PRA339]|uniref:Uncharacterized protein n=1 Tax=Anncaliia algerae PRA339 TaxID=1288291 RepID=A0A059EYA3_9MICR|nr:hypothetical protein H312_02599 [Anncaliia algerae PRA339]